MNMWDLIEEGEANNRLIAAAPDLLAALKDMVNETKAVMADLDTMDMLCPALCEAVGKAQAAISKAEGK